MYQLMVISRNGFFGSINEQLPNDLCDFNVITEWTKPTARSIRLPHWFLGGSRSGLASGESTMRYVGLRFVKISVWHDRC